MRTTGRIVGRFVFNDGIDFDRDINDKTLVSDVWSPLPVTDALADFLALGSRLPGEVRITSAHLNFNHLRPVTLVRVPIGDGPDFSVVVAKEGTEPIPRQIGVHFVSLCVLHEEGGVCDFIP